MTIRNLLTRMRVAATRSSNTGVEFILKGLSTLTGVEIGFRCKAARAARRIETDFQHADGLIKQALKNDGVMNRAEAREVRRELSRGAHAASHLADELDIKTA